MVDYKIVKYCRGCKVRFVVQRGEARQQYCAECQKNLDKQRDTEGGK